jgi:hypothetical protein
MRVTNRFNNKVYFVSVVRIQKRIKLPMNVGLGEDSKLTFRPIEFRTRLQAAVYEYKPNFFRQTLSKPALVVNLSDAHERVPDEEFSQIVRAMFENERVEDLFDQHSISKIFDRSGFTSISRIIWSLFHLSRVRHTFVMKSTGGTAFAR